MNKQTLQTLRMFSTSPQQFAQASVLASSAAGTIDGSTIAGIALGQAAAAHEGDLGILNYALTLEHFENVLYRVILRSGLLSGKALMYAREFGAHENTHVVALTDTIRKLGGKPVMEQARYNLPKVTTQAQALDLLTTVEDVGASAYLGAAPLIKNPDLLTVAVQIHSIEAEHATAMRLLTGMDPLPFAFAPARTIDEVLAIVKPFL